MIESLPGFREFYPERCAVRNYIFETWRRTAKRFGFLEYDAPLLESLELYVEKSGEEITEQLFTFVDRGGREVALRPEMTPSLARLVGKRGQSLKRPIKWFSVSQNFRYEKPQKGRLRSHYQLNADILGEPGPTADAELIALCIQQLTELGLKPEDVWIRLSDRVLWVAFLSSFGFEERQIAELLGIIDKREREERVATIEKLRTYFPESAEDFLGKVEDLVSARTMEDLRSTVMRHVDGGDLRTEVENRLTEWEALLESLDAMELKPFVRIDLGIVRGLAYYTGFVFEAFERSGETRSLAGGGRYDDLIKRLGYMEIPAVGFGMGDVTLTDALEARNLLPDFTQSPEIYVVIGGEAERITALGDIALLRKQRFRVEYPLKFSNIGKQLKSAGQSGARLALIYGSDELQKKSVKIRDLDSREEELVKRVELLDRVKELLGS